MEGKSHPYPTRGPAKDQHWRDLAESEPRKQQQKHPLFSEGSLNDPSTDKY